MLPAFGRVNSSPASFFTETSVVATSSRVIVCPTFATMLEGVDVLPVVVGVLPETVPVVAVVPQAMSPAKRMSARRMAIDLRCDMIFLFLPACLHSDKQDITFFVFKGAAVKATFLHLVMLYQQIEVSMIQISAPTVGIDNVECLS